jgi:hypothetical protein
MAAPPIQPPVWPKDLDKRRKAMMERRAYLQSIAAPRTVDGGDWSDYLVLAAIFLVMAAPIIWMMA